MGRVLKHVHGVRWRELTHAYGDAGDVPGLLARVAFGDEAAAEGALADLGLRIGELAVFDATVEAVPFLWEIALSDSATLRPGVAELLRSVLGHANPPRLEIQRSAHQAVRAGRASAARMTEDGDRAVREAGRALLADIDGHRCEACG